LREKCGSGAAKWIQRKGGGNGERRGRFGEEESQVQIRLPDEFMERRRKPIPRGKAGTPEVAGRSRTVGPPSLRGGKGGCPCAALGGERKGLERKRKGSGGGGALLPGGDSNTTLLMSKRETRALPTTVGGKIPSPPRGGGGAEKKLPDLEKKLLACTHKGGAHSEGKDHWIRREKSKDTRGS